MSGSTNTAHSTKRSDKGSLAYGSALRYFFPAPAKSASRENTNDPKSPDPLPPANGRSIAPYASAPAREPPPFPGKPIARPSLGSVPADLPVPLHRQCPRGAFHLQSKLSPPVFPSPNATARASNGRIEGNQRNKGSRSSSLSALAPKDNTTPKNVSHRIAPDFLVFRFHMKT